MASIIFMSFPPALGCSRSYCEMTICDESLKSTW